MFGELACSEGPLGFQSPVHIKPGKLKEKSLQILFEKIYVRKDSTVLVSLT